MATIARMRLNADQMEVRVFCGGCSYVGIGVVGAFTGGTINFTNWNFASPGGMWGPAIGTPGNTSVYPWPGPGSPSNLTSTGVQSVTAPGNYFWPVQNGSFFSARFTAGTAATFPTVTLAAALDCSWAEAFMTTLQKYQNSAVMGGQNILTIPADPNLGNRLENLVITADRSEGEGGSSLGPTTATWQAQPALKIYDGAVAPGNLIQAFDLNTALPFQYTVPLPPQETYSVGINDSGLLGSVNTPMTIVVASGGGGIWTNINGAFTKG